MTGGKAFPRKGDRSSTLLQEQGIVAGRVTLVTGVER